MTTKPRIYTISFPTVYLLYIQKLEKKGRNEEALRQIITWLTGYDEESLDEILKTDLSLEEFFNQAPHINPRSELIKGVICGMRVENIEDPMIQKIRYLDLLVDELARGKALDKILR